MAFCMGLFRKGGSIIFGTLPVRSPELISIPVNQKGRDQAEKCLGVLQRSNPEVALINSIHIPLATTQQLPVLAPEFFRDL